MSTVSVLVPIYNVEHYIERCSRSLFEQSYQDLEFVFVNDCTPDNSIALLEQVINAYPERKESVHIINHKKNRGLAATRNTGLENSQGEFVIFVDSDDWLDSRAIELLVKKQSETDSDIISGNRIFYLENEERFIEETHYVNKEQLTLQMMRHSWNHLLAGRLFRRSLFIDNNLRWNEGLDVGEDRYMMTLVSYYANKYDLVDNVIYHYDKRNPHALTTTKSGRKILRNNDQELKNVMILEQFFKGKEDSYQEECSKCVVHQMVYNYQNALIYSSRDEYYKVVGLLDNRS